MAIRKLCSEIACVEQSGLRSARKELGGATFIRSWSKSHGMFNGVVRAIHYN
jgi:lipid-binding SYLF domain-containing protein